MGTTTEARPRAASAAGAGPRPPLVTVLGAVWMLLGALGITGAILPLARQGRPVEEKVFAALSLPLAALAGTGAFGLLRRKSWARALLAGTGVAALALSAFGAYRLVTAASAPAAELAASEPDAANALALFRAGSAIAFLVASIPLVVALSLLRHPTVHDWVNPHARVSAGGRRPDALLVAVGGAVLVAALSFFLSKKTSSPESRANQDVAIALTPAETFAWSDQPVVFRTPPAAFTRERHAEGGRKGVSFTRYAVPPTRITVAESFLEPAPNTPEEAFARLRPTEEFFRSTETADIGDPVPAAVGGAPAIQMDYAIRERSMNHKGRELVVLAGRHAFVFSFLGRDADLPLFERLVSSARFPAPGEAAGGAGDAGTTASSASGPEAGGVPFRIGEHLVTARAPEGFERVDYGSRQEFRRGEARIALVDGGELPPGAGPENLEDEWLVQRALRLFGHDPRRWEIGSKTRLSLGGRDALAVETRDPLSHVFHQRTYLWVNGRRLLAAGMLMGIPEENRGPLDALARSVRFSD